MSDDDDEGALGLTRDQWWQIAGAAVLLALLLIGGCRSGWKAPADLPAPPVTNEKTPRPARQCVSPINRGRRDESDAL